MRTLRPVLLIALMGILLSCESLPVDYSRSRSWSAGRKPVRLTVRIMGVKADLRGGWDSVEQEFAALAPLCFWEQGCAAVSGGAAADYIAEIQVREREYSAGWRTRRSLAVEVRMWAGDEPEAALPLAAGRVVAVGERSFSSSDTAERMLSRAVKKTLKALAARKNGA